MKLIYDSVEDTWDVVTTVGFATRQLAEQYAEKLLPICKAANYCQCNCGKHKENGDY